MHFCKKIVFPYSQPNRGILLLKVAFGINGKWALNVVVLLYMMSAHTPQWHSPQHSTRWCRNSRGTIEGVQWSDEESWVPTQRSWTGALAMAVLLAAPFVCPTPDAMEWTGLGCTTHWRRSMEFGWETAMLSRSSLDRNEKNGQHRRFYYRNSYYTNTQINWFQN